MGGVVKIDGNKSKEKVTKESKGERLNERKTKEERKLKARTKNKQKMAGCT